MSMYCDTCGNSVVEYDDLRRLADAIAEERTDDALELLSGLYPDAGLLSAATIKMLARGRTRRPEVRP